MRQKETGGMDLVSIIKQSINLYVYFIQIATKNLWIF